MQYMFMVCLISLCHVGAGEVKKEKVEVKKEKVESFDTYLFPILKSNKLLEKFSKYYFYPDVYLSQNDMKVSILVNDSDEKVFKHHWTHVVHLWLKVDEFGSIKVVRISVRKSISKMPDLGSDEVFSIMKNGSLKLHVRKPLKDGELPQIGN